MNNKKYIDTNEQKQLMLEMLKYIDEVCRKNNIKYSLFAGSLIGAVRHKGYIPWDDDIDIILTTENHEKLKSILDKEKGRYQTLKRGCGGEQFNFIKLIDTRTCAKERKQLKENPNYGVYIDIFCYYPAPHNKKERKKFFDRIELMTKLTARLKPDFKNISFDRNMKQVAKNFISKIIGYKRLNYISDRLFCKYDFDNADYVVSNWPIYGFEKEVQLKKNTEEYIDAKFENLTIMIFKNYDKILKTTFGNYMELPPKSQRISKHHMAMWWRGENE